MKIKYLKILSVFLLLFATSCSTQFPSYSGGIIPLYEQPVDWKDPVKKEETIKAFSKYLTGRTIFLDPGHGGDDRKNSSLIKKIIEADINLRVALYLKQFLEEAGATVLTSRSENKTVDLKARSELANESGADIFISIHHNAGGSSEDYWSDYTSTYYHSREENYNYEPCNHDLAKYIQRDLTYSIRTSGGLGSFDGTASDYNIYPKEGFAVLNNTNIPAVLIECAFHTSRFEEARLGFDEFNEIEAWGIFKGIGKYFRAGIPKINFDTTLSLISKEKTKLIFSFEDINGINEKSILVYCDSSSVTYYYNKLVNILEVSLENLSPGDHIIRVVAANLNKNYAFPYFRKIKIE